MTAIFLTATASDQGPDSGFRVNVSFSMEIKPEQGNKDMNDVDALVEQETDS